MQCVVGFKSDDVASAPLQFVLEAEVRQRGQNSAQHGSSSPSGHPVACAAGHPPFQRLTRGPPCVFGATLLRVRNERRGTAVARWRLPQSCPFTTAPTLPLTNRP